MLMSDTNDHINESTNGSVQESAKDTAKNNAKRESSLIMLGERVRAGHAKAKPIGDRMINAVRGAIWEAWEMGKDEKTDSIYPSVPLLDQLTGREPEPDEPETGW